MPIRSFEVKDQRALTLAKCENVPPIMIIAGPNDSGKSTLLYSLKRREGGAVEVTGNPKTLYIPPHRAWRQRRISYSNLFQPRWSGYSDLLTQDTFRRLEGIEISTGEKTPFSADESASLSKFALSEIESRFGSALIHRVRDNDMRALPDMIPDPFEPLKILIRALLPHLAFSRIDDSQKSNMLCLWKRASSTSVESDEVTEIDVDELSSGEKAVIGLFLPFIERQMHRKLKVIEGKSEEVRPSNMVVLIDEPELHLHPALQDRMLEYMRDLARTDEVQFIIATQSTTLVNAATYEELYLLTLQPEWPRPVNQLIKLTDAPDRLELLRALCGETFPATACRAVLCMEGELPSDLPSSPPDKRLLEILCPETRLAISLPLGGRTQVVEGARRLREILPFEIPGSNVLALVDSDQDTEVQDEDWVFRHTVCMMENYLLDVQAINAFLAPYREQTGIHSCKQVVERLKLIASNQIQNEIRLRVAKRLRKLPTMKKLRRSRVEGTSVEEIERSIDEMRGLLDGWSAKAELEVIVSTARAEVERIVHGNQELRRFHGKNMLDAFHSEVVHRLGISRATFRIELAKEVSKHDAAVQELRTTLGLIEAYVPAELTCVTANRPRDRRCCARGSNTLL